MYLYLFVLLCLIYVSLNATIHNKKENEYRFNINTKRMCFMNSVILNIDLQSRDYDVPYIIYVVVSLYFNFLWLKRDYGIVLIIVTFNKNVTKNDFLVSFCSRVSIQ